MRYARAGALVLGLLVSCGDSSRDAVETGTDIDINEVTGDTVDDPDGAVDTIDDVAPDSDAAPDLIDDVAVDSDAVPDLIDGIDAVAPDTAPDLDAAPEINPAGDSDGDGIFDLVELDDGTDPFDPRSARAWHPELAGHPRLFTRPDARAALAASASADGRAATLWARVRDLAGRAMPEHPLAAGYDTSIPPQQAQIAEAAALIGYATGDATATAKALAVLAAEYPDPAPLNSLSAFNAGDHYDLLEAEALQGFCSAYDLAAGTPDVDPAALDAARARLTARVDDFRKLCMTSGGCTTLLRNEPDNHAIKALAALGTCAMALPDRPTAAADFAEAATAIDWLAHDKQGNLEGGWAESWNYLSYSGETHLGFLAALHHVGSTLGATAWSLRGAGWVTRMNPANGKLVTVLDPAADPLWRAVYERALFATMPSGLTPPVDDANPSALHGGLLAVLFDDARFLWNWDRVGLHTGRQLVATLALGAAALDAPAVTPSWAPDGFFPEAGFSILRSSLAPDASYFHMQHEVDRMRLLGGSHEHADPLSFILAARGTDLAIDPGYIDFANHAKVKYGKDHNIVLVDGQGPEFFLDGFVDSPPNSDAFLHDHAATGPFTTFVASTKYAGAELRRRVARVVGPSDTAPELFVVADRGVPYALTAGTHTWTFQLNGLASEEIGGTAFSLTPTGHGALATWQRPAAWLSVAVVAGGVVTPGSRLEESALASGRHRCLAVDSVAGPPASAFLTLLVPSAPGAAPTFTTRVEGDGLIAEVVIGARTTRVWLNPHDGPVAVDGSVSGGPPDQRTVAEGLTIETDDATATWTMVTPPIPDPTPFIP